MADLLTELTQAVVQQEAQIRALKMICGNLLVHSPGAAEALRKQAQVIDELTLPHRLTEEQREIIKEFIQEFTSRLPDQPGD
jgi:hypothetical protein